MRLTRATEYAYRALRFLASRKEERWFSIQEIAQAEEMPVQFLAKVMQHLTQAGLVHSACGKTGGYRLGRPAAQVKMADVFLAMEGPLSVNMCMMYPTDCKFVEHCKVHNVWQELQDAILNVMNRHTLEEILPTGVPFPLPERSKGRKRVAPAAVG
jgi:Rrf2 family protein